MTRPARVFQVKRDFIEEDEFDRGRRNLLNYGHCFGHALEAASDFAIPHGLAVVVGMRLADLLACRRGLLDRAEATARWRTLYEPVLPSWPVLDAAARNALVGAMAYDKKRTGTGLAVIVVGDGFSRHDCGRHGRRGPRRPRRALARASCAMTRRAGRTLADRFIPRPLMRYREQVLYLAVGGWNTLFGYAVFATLYYLVGDVVGYGVVIVVSYVVAILNAYVGYRYVAFRSHGSVLTSFLASPSSIW